MASERQARLADRIRVLIAERLEKGLRDPRLGFVTITDVRVTGDLQHASVFYTVLGTPEEREGTAAALKAAIRGPKPVNSAWDGSVREVERYLKTVMHDPDSYDHIRSTEPVGEGDYWTVVSSFRGKNAFGALIINTKKFYIQQGEVVKVVDVGD